ncbi:MAG: hypothetical protein SV186_01515 [Candidatus Nanohaloarchaea archaeon]|nr:hypothetical protein [Candidatus Nanohaloarchaea archaeon]
MTLVGFGMAVLRETWQVSRTAAKFMILGLLLYAAYQKRPGIRDLFRTAEYGLGDVLMARKGHVVYGLLGGGLVAFLAGSADAMFLGLTVAFAVFIHGFAGIIREPLEPNPQASLKQPIAWLYLATAVTGFAAAVLNTQLLNALAVVFLLAIIFWRL